ncbi:MAG: hypothetical protein ACRC8A_12660 [Microcoleaceae cyanobacterium]
MSQSLNYWLANQIAVEVPLNQGNDLMEERLAQAIAVDNASHLWLHEKISFEDIPEVILPTFGQSIDDYLDEVVANLFYE